MVVKNNPRLLRRKIERFFQRGCLFEAAFAPAWTQEGGRGRIETRRLQVSDPLPRGYTGFPGVAHLFCIERIGIQKKSGRQRQEIVYGMPRRTSERAGPKRLRGLLGGH